MIKVALIYKKSYKFLSGNHFDNTSYNFFMHALKRNKSIDVSYFPAENYFDVSKLKGKFDVILLPNNNTDGTPNELEGIKKVGIPIISRTGDPHYAKKYNQFQFHEKFNIDYYFNFMHRDYFYSFYPKSYNYKTIIWGLEPSLYQNQTPFKDRIKDKILNSGAIGNPKLISRAANIILNPKRTGWYFYKLRTKCNLLPNITHTGMIGKKYINDDYPNLLSRYKAAIAATTYYPTVKYLEIPAAGNLTFMEITEKNRGQYLGFKDNKSAIFINENNYKQKFEEYFSDKNNPKWEEIANEGKNHVLNNLSNDNAVNNLVEIMQELVY
jgi:hypothetical protein